MTLRWAALAIVLLAVGEKLAVECFKQELWFDLKNGSAIHFFDNVPSLAEYEDILPDVEQVCTKGQWEGFLKPYYSAEYVFWGSPDSAEIECRYAYFNPYQSPKSFRHWAASDTDTVAVSLYTGYYYDEEEYFITEQARTGIDRPIQSLTGTGNASWMFFDGQNLDGNSYCLQIPYEGMFFIYRKVHVGSVSVNLTTIGSAFQGCDLQTIQEYKLEHNLM